MVVAYLVATSAIIVNGAERSALLPAPDAELFHQDVAWSPDGKWIAFSECAGCSDFKPEKWSVSVIAADGTQRRTLLTNALFVSWSPDGRRLAVGSSRDGNWEIYSIDADGTNLKRLTDHPAKDQHPAWSPKGDRIAFSSDREGSPDIHVMNAEGSDIIRLTRDPARDFNPAWNADGTKLIFFREKGDRMDQIVTVTADGLQELAMTNDKANNVFPCYLSDGRAAYVTHEAPKPEQLVLLSADGSRTPCTDFPISFARWSRDGRWIAFIAGDWPRTAIHVMNHDGKDLRKLVN